MSLEKQLSDAGFNTRVIGGIRNHLCRTGREDSWIGFLDLLKNDPLTNIYNFGNVSRDAVREWARDEGLDCLAVSRVKPGIPRFVRIQDATKVLKAIASGSPLDRKVVERLAREEIRRKTI